jgi:hypothetical protein
VAFLTIPASTIESGDPVTQELFGSVKDNFDDHETRILSLEGGGNVSYVPGHWNVQGNYSVISPVDSLGVVRIPFNITVLGGRILILVAGGSGDTEIDFKYKRGAGAWTSIFSSLPTVNFSAGNYAIGSGVLDETSLLIGDLLRMDITAAQGSNPYGLVGIFEFEKT